MDAKDPESHAGLAGSDALGPERAGEAVSGGRSLRLLALLKSFAKVWGFLLFCVLVVYVFRAVALPFIFAVLVVYILAPLVDRMARLRVAGRPFPRGLSVIIIYINLLAVLGLFLGYFIPMLSTDFARLFREAPELFRKLNDNYLPRVGAWVDQNLGAEEDAAAAAAPGKPEPAPLRQLVIETLPDGKLRVDLSGLALEMQPARGGRTVIVPLQPEGAEVSGEGKWERSIKQWIGGRVRSTESEAKRALEYGQRFVTGVISGIARLVLVLMVAAFILVDLGRIRAFVRSLFPPRTQGDFDRIARGVDKGLSGVIRGQLIICLINGILTYIGLRLFDVKYSLLLAVIASVMSVVPIFGSILSSIPIVAVALISSDSFDLAKGLYVLGWIIAIHLLEANYLNPRIMGEAAKIHPVLVVFALIAGEHSYGVVGALFAVPVASIIQTIFTYYRRRGFARREAPDLAAGI